MLRPNGVEQLLDVRTAPGSRRNPQFGKDALATSLEEHGIRYRHLPELGGFRRPRPDSSNGAWRNESFHGYAAYLDGLRAIYAQIAALMREGAVAVVEVANLKHPQGVTTLAWDVAGAIVGLFLASYTGVLLSVSNQPVWSDTWTLGGLFLASGLSGSAALITLLVRYRPDASFSLQRLRLADGYFGVLELALLIAFFATVAIAGEAGRILPWFALWIVALIGIGASLLGVRRPAHVEASGESAAMAPVAMEATVVSAVVLLAVLALRAAVIFSAQ